jgi:uncharacterized coiled-coil protein SlyX
MVTMSDEKNKVTEIYDRHIEKMDNMLDLKVVHHVELIAGVRRCIYCGTLANTISNMHNIYCQNEHQYDRELEKTGRVACTDSNKVDFIKSFLFILKQLKVTDSTTFSITDICTKQQDTIDFLKDIIKKQNDQISQIVNNQKQLGDEVNRLVKLHNTIIESQSEVTSAVHGFTISTKKEIDTLKSHIDRVDNLIKQDGGFWEK